MIDPMEAAHQVITDAVARLSVQALLPPVWRPVAEIPKRGRIMARAWHNGISTETGRLAGCWLHPALFTWDEANNYWAARREGICISEISQHRYVGFVFPDDPPARSNS